jgi:serine/threonine-protein kinase
MLPAGTTLGPYRILEPIGAGGMGEVYRARDARLDRDVAIKVLQAPLATEPGARARFGREAKAVAALSHPGILEIYDVGVEGDICYSVTELLEGETLRARLERGALPWRDAVEIGRAVAQALAAAHAREIVHRDLKPENVFLTRDGKTKILDFGLARRLEPEGAGGSFEATAEYATRPGTVVGTLGYMSPEQLRGLPTDARTDVFAFGAMLYEMLAGRRPFQRGSAAETAAAVLKEDPLPLGALSVAVPRVLEATIERCLGKDPARRFASAAEIAPLLSALDERPAARLPRAAAYVAGALLLAGAGGAFLWRGLSRPEAPPRVTALAVLPMENLTGNPDQEFFADGMTEALIARLARTSSLRVTSRTSVMQYKGSRKALPEIARELGVDAVVEGSVMRAEERVRITAQLVDARRDRHLWAETYDRDLRDVLALQSEVARAIAAEISGQLVPREPTSGAGHPHVDPRVYESYLRGRHAFWQVTRDSLARSRAYLLEATAADPTYAPAWAALADTYVTMGVFGFQPPREAYTRAREAAARALDLNPELSEAWNALAMITRDYDWDWSEADRLFRKAIALDPQSSFAHHMYAIQHAWLGRFDEALAGMERARALDPLNLAVNADGAYVLHLAGRYPEAIAQYRRTLEMDPGYVVALREVSASYELSGRLEEAIASLEKALARSPETSTRAWLAREHALAGRTGEARRRLEALLRAASDEYVSCYDVALVHHGLGNVDEAFRWLEKAVAVRDTNGLPALKVDPRLRGLRPDPRFADLLRRMGAP